MRILMLTQLFQPEPNHLKGIAFARELQRRGHTVDVLTGFPNYPGGQLYAGYRMRWLQRETIDGVHVTRVPLYPSHDTSGFRRFLCYSSFALSASVLGLPALDRPDVVHVYQGAATLALPAIVNRVFQGVSFVLDVQDLWPDSVAASGMMAHPRALSAVDVWCRVTYRLARDIVVLSPGYKAALVGRGVPEEKIHVVYNWNAQVGGATPRTGSDNLPDLGGAGTFKIVFAGNLGRVQQLDAVVHAALLVKREAPQVRVIFIGEGVEAPRLMELAARVGTSNVLFIPRQPPERIGDFLAAADVLLIHLRDDPLSRIGIPQKTQAYLAAGRPLLMAIRGDAADLVMRAGAGIVCEPGNAGSIAAGMRQLATMPLAEREDMGLRGRAFHDEQLSFRVGARRMAEILEQAAKAT